jgi:hypothetical protein
MSAFVNSLMHENHEPSPFRPPSVDNNAAFSSGAAIKIYVSLRKASDTSSDYKKLILMVPRTFKC